MKLNSYFCLVIVLLFVLGGITPSLADPDSIQSKWTPTGDLITARTCHTATLLHNGQVLIVGGHGYSGDLASAELYDPIKGAFSQTANLAQGRTSHTATLLRNGQVLVVGGQFNGTVLADVELYNPETGTWKTTSSLHIARVFHTATLLKDGRVLVVGGSRAASPPVFYRGVPAGNALDTAEVYDPRTAKWTVVDNLHEARFLPAATLLDNDQVLISGGSSQRSNGDSLATAELFNPANGTWTVTGSLLGARYGHSSVLLPDEKVLVVGGALFVNNLATTELYNPSTGTWAASGNTHQAVSCSATFLPDGKVMVCGGHDDAGVLTHTELYDSSTGTWTKSSDMNTARDLNTITLLDNGQVLVTGGSNGNGSPSGVLSSAELYEPGTNNGPKSLLSGTIPLTQAQVASTVSTLSTLTVFLVIFTGCLVVLTACVVILLCAWLVFALVRRWGK
jgi:N-acetylneuraminic acid mutarotase